jgi:hypothetical protein
MDVDTLRLTSFQYCIDFKPVNEDNMIVNNKRQNYKLFISGEYGNHLKSWTLDEYEKSNFSGLVTIMYRGPFSGGPCYYDVTRLNVKTLILDIENRGFSRDDLLIYESAPDDHIIIQGEYLNTAPGAFYFSTCRYKMRDALKVDGVNVTSIRGRIMLQNAMSPSSWEDFQVLLDKYPEHVIELSVYNKNLGNIQGRNTIIWEVRNY